MKPIVNKITLAAAAGLAAILLSGCVYYPQQYGYGGGYYAYPYGPAPYAPAPAINGSVTFGGWWWGGHDDDWHDRGWHH